MSSVAGVLPEATQHGKVVHRRVFPGRGSNLRTMARSAQVLSDPAERTSEKGLSRKVRRRFPCRIFLPRRYRCPRFRKNIYGPTGNPLPDARRSAVFLDHGDDAPGIGPSRLEAGGKASLAFAFLFLRCVFFVGRTAVRDRPNLATWSVARYWRDRIELSSP
jgi:hypothetical protein